MLVHMQGTPLFFVLSCCSAWNLWLHTTLDQHQVLNATLPDYYNTSVSELSRPCRWQQSSLYHSHQRQQPSRCWVAPQLRHQPRHHLRRL